MHGFEGVDERACVAIVILAALCTISRCRSGCMHVLRASASTQHLIPCLICYYSLHSTYYILPCCASNAFMLYAHHLVMKKTRLENHISTKAKFRLHLLVYSSSGKVKCSLVWKKQKRHFFHIRITRILMQTEWFRYMVRWYGGTKNPHSKYSYMHII